MSIKDLISQKREYASVHVDSTGRVSVNKQVFFREDTVKNTVATLKSTSKDIALTPPAAPAEK